MQKQNACRHLLSKFSLSATPHNGPLGKVSPNWSPLHSHILSFVIILEEGSMLFNDLLTCEWTKAEQSQSADITSVVRRAPSHPSLAASIPHRDARGCALCCPLTSAPPVHTRISTAQPPFICFSFLQRGLPLTSLLQVQCLHLKGVLSYSFSWECFYYSLLCLCITC